MAFVSDVQSTHADQRVVVDAKKLYSMDVDFILGSFGKRFCLKLCPKNNVEFSAEHVRDSVY